MSYDLFVFDPSAAPREPVAFGEWFTQTVEGGEGGDDPAVLSLGLRAWYREMIKKFPAMNGPDARTGFLANLFISDRITGYDCSPHAIYMDFRWDFAEAAYERTLLLARKHHLGFYDVSGEGDVWAPGEGGVHLVMFRVGQ